MRLLLLTVLINWIAGIGMASSHGSELLTSKVWKLSSDEMSGVGLHTSLAKGTKLEFDPNGTWKSSHPINEAQSGNWRLENNGHTLIMTMNDQEINYLIVELNTNELHIRLKKKGATYNLTWVAED
jgi:hypothetical protein